jgi:hypothetical protein
VTAAAIPAGKRSTIEQAINTHYIAGLHFWTTVTPSLVVVWMRYSTAPCSFWQTTETVSPRCLSSTHPTASTAGPNSTFPECPVQGGQCFEGHSGHAFRELLLPLLNDDDFPRVLDKLAEIHADYFAPAVITYPQEGQR